MDATGPLSTVFGDTEGSNDPSAAIGLVDDGRGDERDGGGICGTGVCEDEDTCVVVAELEGGGVGDVIILSPPPAEPGGGAAGEAIMMERMSLVSCCCSGGHKL